MAKESEVAAKVEIINDPNHFEKRNKNVDPELVALFDLNDNVPAPSVNHLESLDKHFEQPNSEFYRPSNRVDPESLAKAMLDGSDDYLPIAGSGVDAYEMEDLYQGLTGEEPPKVVAFVKPEGEELHKLKKELREARISENWDLEKKLEKQIFGKVL
jgi:hypothetical protein